MAGCWVGLLLVVDGEKEIGTRSLTRSTLWRGRRIWGIFWLEDSVKLIFSVKMLSIANRNTKGIECNKMEAG